MSKGVKVQSEKSPNRTKLPLSVSQAFYHLLGSHHVGELTNGFVQKFTEGGSGNFKEGAGILNGEKKGK